MQHPRIKGPLVWLDMDQQELDDAYDQVVYAPNRDQVGKRRIANSDTARVAIGYRTDARLFSGRELGRSKRVRERHIDVFDQLRPPPGSISARELGVEAKPPKIVSPPRK